MSRIIVIVFLLSFWNAAQAQLTLRVPGSVRSRSGQFVVRTVPGAGATIPDFDTNRNLVRLEPTLLTVSCERVKQILGRTLESSGLWRGKIYLVLYPAASFRGAVTITSERFADGWQYRIELPDVIERSRYVRALVQAILLEMANRNATSRSAEIPSWLIEGLAQELLASNELQIVLSPPPASSTGLSFVTTQVDAQSEDPLKRIHAFLSNHQALTFEELSWWAEAEASPLYSASAQLFVHQLLNLPDGRSCTRNMLAEFSQRLNWQFAFQHAFNDYFSRPLDTEKWWALQVAQFSGRDLVQTWSGLESWHKLDQALHTTLEFRTQPNELPKPTEVNLQSLIREWDVPRQKEVLQIKLHDLDSLRLRLCRELVDVVDQYRRVIDRYLRNRESLAFVLPFRKQAVARQIVDSAIKELDSLDALRRTLRPKTETSVSAVSSARAEH